MDYAAWLRRAIAFCEGLRNLPGTVKVTIDVSPPLPATALESLAASSRLPIPASLKCFWTEASSRCHCKYWWDTPDDFHPQKEVAFSHWSLAHIWGGPEFESASDMCKATHDFLDWAESFRPNYPRDARFWEHSFPLIPVGDGDYAGLYVRDNVDDPPVVYLCHDGCGSSKVMAPNLAEFLRRWEQVGYVGIHFLTEFWDWRTNEIAPSRFPVEREAVNSMLRGQLRLDIEKPPLTLSSEEWSSCKDPEIMLEWLKEQGRLNERQVRLYCCACCRRVWDLMGPWSRNAVEVAERFAHGRATSEELAAARTALMGGERGEEVERDFGAPSKNLDLFLPSFPLDDSARAREDSDYVEIQRRFLGALNQSMEFARSQGVMHDIAYAAVDAHEWISGLITQHLEEPAASIEKAAHAAIIRQVFGSPEWSGLID